MYVFIGDDRNYSLDRAEPGTAGRCTIETKRLYVYCRRRRHRRRHT